jgi:hypothetical protein
LGNIVAGVLIGPALRGIERWRFQHNDLTDYLYVYWSAGAHACSQRPTIESWFEKVVAEVSKTLGALRVTLRVRRKYHTVENSMAKIRFSTPTN